jgi:hypothetical protein
LGEPVSLFAEEKGARRERLRKSIIDFFLQKRTNPSKIFKLPIKNWDSFVGYDFQEIKKLKK